MNTNYKSSEVGGSPENQASTFKTGINFGQPVGEKKKESPSGEKDRDRSRHKEVNKKKKGEEALRQPVLWAVPHPVWPNSWVFV